MNAVGIQIDSSWHSFYLELKRIANDYVPDNDQYSALALTEMREALQSLTERFEIKLFGQKLTSQEIEECAALSGEDCCQACGRKWKDHRQSCEGADIFNRFEIDCPKCGKITAWRDPRKYGDDIICIHCGNEIELSNDGGDNAIKTQ